MSQDSTTFPPNSDTDIIIVSSDGVRYGVHSKNLETGTGGFPPVGPPSQGGSGANGIVLTREDAVHLTETSSVLDLLFQFIYPMRRPNIVDLDFENLMGLAEAAEKYEVYSAMDLCRTVLRYVGTSIQDHPVELVAFSIKHDYPDILELAAKQALRVPLPDALPFLRSDMVIPWVNYYTRWLDIYHKIPNLLASKHHQFWLHGREDRRNGAACDGWRLTCNRATLNYANEGLGVLTEVRARLFTLDLYLSGFSEAPICCEKARSEVMSELESQMEVIPPFSTFLGKSS